MRRLAICSCVLALLGIYHPAAAEESTRTNLTEFSLQEGSNTVMYATADQPEEMQWGPTALTVAPDGTFWISNSYVNKLTHVSAEGSVLGTIDLKPYGAVGITDLKAMPYGLVALDAGAPDIRVLKLSYSGQLIQKYVIPASLERSITGLIAGQDGELYLEARGIVKYRLLSPEGTLSRAWVRGATLNGETITITPATRNRPRAGSIQVGDVVRNVWVNNYLGGLRLLGINPASTQPGGSFYVIVVDLAPNSSGFFRFDYTVRHYRADGRLLGVARFPINQQYVNVAHPLAIAPDGSVYGLVTREDSARVIKLAFSSSLSPLFPKGTVTTSSPTKTLGAYTSRSAIASRAWDYVNNSRYYTSTNISGTCGGRDAPRYLLSPGTYTGVAYDWGGWDTVSAYNYYLDRGYQAGDIAETNVGAESCSRGVDCSGFVTRAWGRSDQKYYTASLPNISYALPGPWSLETGDIMNQPSSHVRLVSSVDGNGAFVWESTAYAGMDRVVYRYIPWTSFLQYQPRRYSYLSNP